ncbi:Protein-tyrosine-phosphatase mkp1 [Phytophthora pseudosyringae]|uniref:Protein-tyrosine-phosphatase mkp1 n=1 Tax=Phytophthora pseudosyringae TaxID=221518 RepID=A0A8T1W617_9STRA|nr:Protein-tyrosine-phosphatase mkp1 [Phytophthora pseudosyringae]
MGNGQSREDFAGVLPSVAATTVSTKSDPPLISDAWTSAGENSEKQSGADSGAKVPPVLVGKIATPGHALQQDKNTSRPSLEASEVARAFNKGERTEDRFVIPESVRKSRTLDAHADVCSEILPGFLYVSNLRVARDTAKLRALGITHVINCCGELKQYDGGVEKPAPTSDAEIDTLRLLLRDDASEDLTPFLPQVLEYIAACRKRTQSQDKENGEMNKVLVHCHQGVSRSCAFAIAYVMLEQRLSYHEASGKVKRQRAISSPNAAFICQLLEWEKDLHAMGTSAPAFALGGLHRLAPHSNYDPECLVLKRCYEPSAGPARQRQNMAMVRSLDDERRLLWSQGTFVFQSPASPSDLIVWHGAKCVIQEAVSRATELAQQFLRMQTLVQGSDIALMPMKIVEVLESSQGHAGTDIDYFDYAAELQWRRESVPKTPQLLLPSNRDTSTKVSNSYSDQPDAQSANDVSSPQLFTLEAIGEQDGDDLWDQVTNYDSDDLTPDSAFLLFSMKAQELVQGYVWIGTSCVFPPEKVVQVAQKQIQGLQNLPENGSSPSLVVEQQNQESDAFWELFEAGY